MSKLFTPISIKNLELKNRIVMAPMCQFSADADGFPQNWHFIHYSSRAIGGVGLILLEATAIDPDGRIMVGDLGLWDDKHIAGLKSIVDECKKHGAKIGIQLFHAGRKCTAPTKASVAPSSIPFSEEYTTPHELTKEEILEIVNAFKAATKRAIMAGFDTIEIHGAHGYLINQFLSPLSNKRNDEYGGSPENRVRFLKEILEAVREVWSKDKALLLRVSAEDYVAGGNTSEDTAYLINLVKEFEIDLVNVSSGAVVPAEINPYPGYQITFSEIIRDLTDIPTIAGGLVTSPDMAEEILSNERADLIFIGRELLRNPYWPLYAANALGVAMPWPDQYRGARLDK